MVVNITVPKELWPDRRDWQGHVVEIHKSEGEEVLIDDPLVDVEIEKAVLVIESPVNGVVEKVLVKVGDKVTPDTILMRILEK